MNMAQEVPDDLKDLIVRFVRIYSGVTDLALDHYLNPKPWFMPLNSILAKREAAHYFLLAASLSDNRLTGNPRNIRILLYHLYSRLGGKLYTTKIPVEFTGEIRKFEQDIKKLDQLGEAKDEIPEILSSVNRFIEQRAHGDLIEYTTMLSQKGNKPKDFVEELMYKVKRMNKHHKAKSWLYLRWMTRGPPDLGLFPYNPKDLMVPLSTPKFRVYASLGLSDNENLPFQLNAKNKPESWWNGTAEFDDDANRLTSFARSLFPDDPAKVDFPFFILGTWLENSDLTPVSLERSLRFFIQKYQELLQPLMRYLTVVSHYNKAGEEFELGVFTGLEKNVYDFLKNKQVTFNYEFMEFRLSKENPTTDRSLTYKPDFLLPQLTDKGRKILLEPHGVKNNLKGFLYKLSTFRKLYGDYFCLILVVPDDFIEAIDKLDPKHLAYDYIWKQSEYKRKYEKLQNS